MKRLGPDADRVQVLFVTVDPQRDTPELLSKYVPAFDPRFAGLYGDAAATERTAKEFKIIYQKQPGATPGHLLDGPLRGHVHLRSARPAAAVRELRPESRRVRARSAPNSAAAGPESFLRWRLPPRSRSLPARCAGTRRRAEQDAARGVRGQRKPSPDSAGRQRQLLSLPVAVCDSIFDALHAAYDYFARPPRLVPNTAAGMPESPMAGARSRSRWRPGIFSRTIPRSRASRRELTAADYVWQCKRDLRPAHALDVAVHLRASAGGIG